MNYRELFYFAGQCLTMDDIPKNQRIVEKAVSNGVVPINDFIRLCDENLILPVIYQKFKNHHLLTFLPPEIIQLLEEIYSLNHKRNCDILHQIDEINTQLHQEKIIPVYLKGCAHLLCGLYDNPGERMIGDIDFLVRKNDFLKAAQVILELGYYPLFKYYDHMIDYKHYPPLCRDDRPVLVEIHGIPVDSGYSRQFSTSQVFQKAVMVPGKENCFVPSDENQIILNFIHSQLSNFGYWCKKSSLRDIYDFYLLTKRMSPSLVAEQAQHTNKMRGYVMFAEKVLNIKGRLCDSKSTNAQLHTFFCDRSLEYPQLNHLYCAIITWIRRLFGYLNRLTRFVLQRNYREYIIKR